VARHSGARYVHITIRDRQGTLVLDVHDDGAGFDVSGSNGDQSRGRGLQNMRRRAAQVGGRFDIVSAPGRGTRITFTGVMS
jgi:two-component system NarL family sensor kinase